MRRWSFFGLATIATIAIGATATTARADLPTPRLVPQLEPPSDRAADTMTRGGDPWSSRPFAVHAQGGSTGGPLGYGGLSFEWAPTRYTVFGAGGGFSSSGPTGAFMPRLRFPLNRWVAVGLGFPLSLGPYEYVMSTSDQCAGAGCEIAFRTTRQWTMAFWGHLEPNVEFRLGNGGVALRVYGGPSLVLNNTSDRCTSTLPGGCPSSLGEQRIYGGLSLGYAW
ncbi:MAG: hypothetical protein KF819_29025 [Labilithrix sp.]|nr:hypothetical protein [Labilithrix sp.]